MAPNCKEAKLAEEVLEEEALKEEALKKESLKKEAPEEKAKLIKEKEEVKLKLLDAIMFGKLDAALSEITKAEASPQPAQSKEDEIRATLLASGQDGSLDAALAKMTPAPRAASQKEDLAEVVPAPQESSTPSASKVMQEEIKANFAKISADKSGTLPVEKLYVVMSQICPAVDSEKLQSILTSMNANQDGVVKCNEFVDWLYEGIVGTC
mmetsp:Transcript_70987/g.129960  ORF Transcript_70987/g.129960 Transcript_70987/m.129960 type:complete len:210 (-) Transcript_70987:249-878(-)